MNPTLSLSQLIAPRSSKPLSLIFKELDKELRFFGGHLIETCGLLLKLPQVAMATASVLFQRFYHVSNFLEHDIEKIVLGALFLSTKIEECHRKLRQLIVVYHYVYSKWTLTETPLTSQSHLFQEYSEKVKEGELLILTQLGFIVHTKHPYGYMINYAQTLQLDKQLIQTAWNYLNDSYRTDLCTIYQPHVLACASIYLSARLHSISLPEPECWIVFDCEEMDLKRVATIMHELTSPPTFQTPPLTTVIVKELSVN